MVMLIGSSQGKPGTPSSVAFFHHPTIKLALFQIEKVQSEVSASMEALSWQEK
jgi:hypothetical protein